MGQVAVCQVRIHGTVFDLTKKRPLEGVSVLTNKSGGTSTDIHGNYSIWVDANDSIYFSYLGRPTMKYPVRTIVAANNFDISLQVKSDLLPEVIVRQRSYQEDSLQNRLDYDKIFDYNKPRFKFSALEDGSGQAGAGVDLDALIDIFRIRKKKNTLAFQSRLVDQEEDRYIDHKFNKNLVKKLTGLEGEKLDTFMKRNRPDYYFVKNANEYDFYEYIKERGEKFKASFLQQKNDIKTP
jgi:hypothetical protein